MAAVADLGAVRRPASKWERLVRGVGAPPSLLALPCLIVSKESGLIFWLPRREASPPAGIGSPLAELKEFEVI